MNFKFLIFTGLLSFSTSVFAGPNYPQKCMDLILQIEGSRTGYAAAACAGAINLTLPYAVLKRH